MSALGTRKFNTTVTSIGKLTGISEEIFVQYGFDVEPFDISILGTPLTVTGLTCVYNALESDYQWTVVRTASGNYEIYSYTTFLPYTFKITSTANSTVDEWLDENTETAVILKAGTYTFNNDLTFYDFINPEYDSSGNYYLNFDIPFTIGVTVEDENLILEFRGLSLSYKSIQPDQMTMMYLAGDYPIPVYINNAWRSDVSPEEIAMFQTINVTKETAVSETFGTWFIANTNYNEVNAVSKKFTRLYLGATVYSSNGKRFRKLQTEEPEEPTPQIVNVTHKLIANIPVNGSVTGISKVYDGVIYVTAWNSNSYLTTIYEVNAESGDYRVLYSKVFYESSTKPQNVIKVNGDLYVSFCDTTKTYIEDGDWNYVYTHIVNLTQDKAFDDYWSVSSYGSSFGYFLSHTNDSIYITWIYSKFRWNFFCHMYVSVYKVELDLSGQTRVRSPERRNNINSDYPDYYWGKYYGNINGSISTNTYTETFNSSYKTISNSTYENGVLFDIGGGTFFVSEKGYYGKFNRESGKFSDVVELGISVLSTTNGETVIPVASGAGAIYVLQQTDK